MFGLNQSSGVYRPATARLLAGGLCAAAVLLGANIAQATDARFVPNAVGNEVADTYTGLIWRRCAEGQNWDGTHCTGSYTILLWDAALAHAQSEASRTSLAWRVPNVKELKSLVNPAASGLASYSAFPDTPTAHFGVSTPYVGNSELIWFVSFRDGSVSYNHRGNGNAVRLVRTAP
jgi:hypothetical protein